MRFQHWLIIISLVCISTPGFSQETSPDNFLTFQVIQNEMIFDNANIKSASLIQNNGVFNGLEIELKAQAAEEMARVTKASLGKKITILLNKRVVAQVMLQTPLGNKLLITGITKYEAEAFLNLLHLNQQKMDYLKEREEAEREQNNPQTPPPIVQTVVANSSVK